MKRRKKWGGRTNDTGTPALGSPPVPSGPDANRISLVYSVFVASCHYLTLDSRVGTILPMKPTVMGTGTRLGEERGFSM